MSDQQQGPGWWLASDGKWYPPDQAPALPPPQTWGPPPGPPPRQGVSSGTKAGIIAASVIGAFVLLIAGVTLLGEESTSRFSSVGSAIDESSDDREDPDGTGGEPADAPDGFEIVDGDGVSIAAPEEWTVLDAGDLGMTSDEFLDAFPDAPPEMVEQGADMFAQGAVLVAFDFTNASFASNVNILDVPGEAPLGIVSEQAEQQIDALGGDVLDSGNVTVPVGEVARIEYTLEVSLPDGSTMPTGGVQFYVPFDGRTYIITVSGVDHVAELADQMIETFRVG
jgi:hypothetical protein